MAAMTRWDPMESLAAEARIRRSAERLALVDRLGAPPVSPELSCDVAHIVEALDALRTAPLEIRKLALECALEVALDQETLSLPQHLAMRTTADALAVGPRALERLFRERTRRSLPPPWDPSLPEAWPGGEQRDSTGHQSAGGHPAGAPEQILVDAPRMARIKALALLGLDEGATEEEIGQAFRRVSKVHHPDQFQTLGEEATQEATRTFLRIKEAHDFLMRTSR